MRVRIRGRARGTRHRIGHRRGVGLCSYWVDGDKLTGNVWHIGELSEWVSRVGIVAWGVMHHVVVRRWRGVLLGLGLMHARDWLLMYGLLRVY